jgi:WS/DGAT/MGAT family acyltransferase
MSQSELRRRMRGSDAMFLYFERKQMPLHIGTVAVLDGSFDEECERLLAARLPEIPRYRQRVMFAPLNVTHPTWEDDPAFDIKNHIRRVKIEPPGTDAQLSELSGQVFTELMDRNRPLWDLTVVEGLEGGRSALIIRVHHCMVDGVSGIALVNVMFDTARVPRPVKGEPWNPSPLPTAQEVLVDGLSNIWADAAERLVGAQVTLLRLAQAFSGDTGNTSARALAAAVPDLLRPTEKLPFNKPCSGVRGHCWTRTSFGEARAIRSSVGGTINDVVLAVVTGAVMRYVKAHREPLSGRFVRMMVPVNTRTEDPHGRTGNEISMIPLSTPLDVEDPVERLREVARRSAVMKSARIADVVQLIGTGIGWMPPALQQPVAALPFMPQPVPIVNMVCTNVPGPMVPLYANGRELLTYYPHVPCGSDVGIGVAISSYNQSMFYGVTYDVQAAPDGELFRDFLVESYEELRTAAGVRPMAAQPVTPRPAAAKAATPADLRAHRQTEPEQPAAAAPKAEAAEAPPEPVPASAPEPEVAAAASPEPPVAQEPATVPAPAVEAAVEVSAAPAAPEAEVPAVAAAAVKSEPGKTESSAPAAAAAPRSGQKPSQPRRRPARRKATKAGVGSH